MKVTHGTAKAPFGPGINIDLTGDEVAIAIAAFLVARGIQINGPRTVSVNGELCEYGNIYVDSSGSVVYDGMTYSGRGGFLE